jgi:plastocyanin
MTAQPRPGAAIEKVYGDNQAMPANFPTFLWIGVTIRDEFGNPLSGQAVTWTVISGPVHLSGTGGTTDDAGQVAVRPIQDGTEGVAVVRASLPGGHVSADFTLTATAPVWHVRLQSGAFLSGQNGSSPAVDTIAVGGTATWLLDAFDYEDHAIVSVGLPAFQASGFSYVYPSEVTVTFSAPGTYQYADLFPNVTGTLVVK